MKVYEIFNSIDGEGKRTGILASFIRLAGCNLRCRYCDTTYAFDPTDSKEMSIEQIVEELNQYHCPNVTLTGGDPLSNPDAYALIEALVKVGYKVNVETNGSIPINPYTHIPCEYLFLTMDYKLPSSGMESKMVTDNLELLREGDVLKFVVSDIEDLNRMKEILDTHSIKAQIYISPVYGEIDMRNIVQYMKDNNLTNARLQIQLHKVIWTPETKGV